MEPAEVRGWRSQERSGPPYSFPLPNGRREVRCALDRRSWGEGVPRPSLSTNSTDRISHFPRARTHDVCVTRCSSAANEIAALVAKRGEELAGNVASVASPTRKTP